MSQTTSKISEKLIEDGIYIFPEPMATPEQIKKMIDIQEQNLGKDDGSYQFGRAGRLGSLGQWKNTVIEEVFKIPVITETAKDFMTAEMNGPPNFSEIFITHDYRSDQGTARNGYLHFDRLGTFKFFMYLTDCDKDSGAFSYYPGTYQLGKSLRKKEQGRDYANIKNRLEIDYPELGYKTEDVVPIEGPAGTMFVFHSDVFHMGGSVADGRERRVIRLHYR